MKESRIEKKNRSSRIYSKMARKSRRKMLREYKHYTATRWWWAICATQRLTWKEAEDHRSASTVELKELTEKAQGYVDQRKENEGQIESKYKQLRMACFNKTSTKTKCGIPKELSMKITELTGHINTNVAVADGTLSSLKVAEDNYQQAKATHKSTMENLNTRSNLMLCWINF